MIPATPASPCGLLRRFACVTGWGGQGQAQVRQEGKSLSAPKRKRGDNYAHVSTTTTAPCESGFLGELPAMPQEIQHPQRLDTEIPRAHRLCSTDKRGDSILGSAKGNSHQPWYYGAGGACPSLPSLGRS